MLYLSARLLFFLWTIFILLIATSRPLGNWYRADAFVYRASIAQSSDLTDIRLFDVRTGVMARLLRDWDIISVQAAPDDRYILIERRQGRETILQVMNLRSGEQYALQQGVIDMSRWSPDGQWIAYRLRRGATPGIYRILAAGGDSQYIMASVSLYHWSGDSERLVYLKRSEDINVVDVHEIVIRSGEDITLLPNERLINDIIGWGEMLMVLQNGRLMRYDYSTKTAQPLTDSTLVGMNPVISPYRERLALVIFDKEQRNPFVVLNRDGDILASYDLPQRIFSSYVGWAVLR